MKEFFYGCLILIFSYPLHLLFMGAVVVAAVKFICSLF